MKKKVVALVLSLAMVSSLVACGGGSSNTNTNTDKEATTEGSAPEWKSYDEKIAQIRKETDLAKREALMHEAEDQLMDTWAVVPLYYYNDVYLQKTDVENIYANLFGFKYFGFAKTPTNELALQIASEPDKLDPALNSTVDGACLAILAFSGLYAYDEDGQLVPELAESYEMSDDALTYTFKMRDGLKWSDGETLDANDVVYSWNRLANPDTAADYSYLTSAIATNDDGTLQIEASEDGKTFTVHLTAPCAYFLDLCAFPFFFPVNQKSVEGNDDWANDASDKFVTNGAFTLKEWKHDSSMTYVKNPNYWDADNVTVDEMNVMLTSDDVSAYTAYQNGDLDFIDSIPTAEIEAAKKTSEFYTVDNLGTYYAGFNINSKLYSDLGLDADQAKVFRHAICLLIDRQYIIDTIAQGGQKIATTFIPEGVTDGNGGEFKNKDYYGTDYDKNFEEAKELLASIGLLDESTGQVNQTIEFSYLVNNSEANVKIGEAIQADLSKVGINLKVEQQEWNVFLNSRKDGQFDFAREGWLMDYNDAINMLEMFTTKSGNNDMQFGR